MSQVQIRRFLVGSADAELAERTIQEVRDLGGNIDHIDLCVGDPSLSEEDYSIFTPHEPASDGIMGLRHECRQIVLDVKSVDVPKQVATKEQLKALGMDTHRFGVVRDGWGKIQALASNPDLLMTPTLKALLEVRPTNRTWDQVEVWYMFYASVVEQNQCLLPKAGVFLFKDEWETLKQEGKLLTYNYHDVYNEIFEGFVLHRDESDNEPVLWKVRGYLLD